VHSIAATNPQVVSADSPPAVRAAFEPARNLADAQEFTRQLAQSHYENFSVVSLLLPRHLRQDFCNIYAFCRIADDLGDEIADPDLATASLARFADATRASIAGEPPSAVFVALHDTIRRHDIPIQPFLDLIDAFGQDQRVARYETFAQLLDYCRRSADPVGRLVLYVCGYRDAERQRLSDRTCSALQLANFWQDVRRDLIELDRIYIPAESMRRFGVSEAQLRAGQFDENYRALMRFEVDRTESMFDQGEALLPMLEPAVRSHVALFARGGRAILRAIRNQDYDTLTRRPRLSAVQKSRLIASGFAAQLTRVFARPARDGGGSQ
jgi:squalene synthase HpnC